MPEDGVNVLRVEIKALNLGRALEMMEGRITRHKQHGVCVKPAHVVVDCYCEPDRHPLFNSSGLTTLTECPSCGS